MTTISEAKSQPDEIGKIAQLPTSRTNYHDAGEGPVTFLIHGSGPGVSAWANWRTVIPVLSPRLRLIAPDMIGFGFTTAAEVRFDISAWTKQVIDLADLLGVERFNVVGNSFGGAMALHLAAGHPDRVSRLVLMGSAGGRFEITPALERVWGYKPSPEAMHQLMDDFVYDKSIIQPSLVALRLKATQRPAARENYEALFPAPRQRWVDALEVPTEALARIDHDVLLLHGEDDAVIPLAASCYLAEHLPNARLETLPECGHWIQIEKTAEFCQHTLDFLVA